MHHFRADRNAEKTVEAIIVVQYFTGTELPWNS